MSSYNNRQFRMTVWPGVPLPLPPLMPRRAQYQLSERGDVVIGTGGWRQLDQPGQREVYLKLYTLDLDDPNAILRFAKTYGAPSGILAYSALAGNSVFGGLLDAGRELNVEQVYRSEPALQAELADVVSLTSFRFAARLLADLTDAWRIVRLDPRIDIANHHWRLPYNFDHADIRSSASVLLGDGLTPLLSRFRPYVRGTPVPEGEEEIQHEAPAAKPDGGVHLETAASIPFAHLAEFCALELFNHIAGSEAYRICENDHCRQIFVLQYGRQKHGMSKREGVKYCCKHCAQAKAARDLRARKRAGTAKTRRSRRAANRKP